MSTSRIAVTAIAALGTFVVLMALLCANAMINYRVFVLSEPDSFFRSTCGAFFVLGCLGLTYFWKWAVFEPVFSRFVKPAAMG